MQTIADFLEGPERKKDICLLPLGFMVNKDSQKIIKNKHGKRCNPYLILIVYAVLCNIKFKIMENLKRFKNYKSFLETLSCIIVF